MTTLCLCELSDADLASLGIYMNDGFKKWEPLPSTYVDPLDLVRRQFEQSERTVGGRVAEFAETSAPFGLGNRSISKG